MPVSHKGKNIVKKTKTKTKTKLAGGGGSKNKSRRSSRSRRSSNNNKQKNIINHQNNITIESLIKYFENETIEEFNLNRSKDIKDQLMKINFPTLNQLLYDLSIIKLKLYDKLIKGTYTYKTGNTLIYSGYTNINDFITDYKFIVNFTGYVYEFDDESSYRSYKHVNSITDPLSYNDIMDYMTKYNFDKKKVENSIKRWESFGAKKITVDNIKFKKYALSNVPRWFTENYVRPNSQSYYNYLKDIGDIGNSEVYYDFLDSLRSDEIDKEEKELLSSNV